MKVKKHKLLKETEKSTVVLRTSAEDLSAELQKRCRLSCWLYAATERERVENRKGKIRIAKGGAEKDGCHMQHETTMSLYQPLKQRRRKSQSHTGLISERDVFVVYQPRQVCITSSWWWSMLTKHNHADQLMYEQCSTLGITASALWQELRRHVQQNLA